MAIPGVVLFLEQRNLIPVQLLWLVCWWPGSRGAEVAAISVIGRAWAEPVDDYWLLASSQTLQCIRYSISELVLISDVHLVDIPFRPRFGAF